MPKRRILSRQRVCEIMAAEIDRKETASNGELRQAQMDIFFYMIADGSTVKIYEDRDMGGTVVEF